MKLSILVCTVVERCDTFAPSILKQLKMQKKGLKDVELLYLGDDCDMTVGEKRNRLLEIARGEYVVFVDDDDRVSVDYVDSLIEACRHNNDDAVCFNAYIAQNGGKQEPVHYSVFYDKDKNGDGVYYRIPNHLMCVKRDLALKVGYKNLSFGEDSEYAKRLHRLLRSETQIDKFLYYYDFNTQTTLTQR